MRLCDRRARGDLIETFKIVKKRDFFEFDTGGRRGHSKKLFKKRCRLDIRKYTFSNIVDKWNSLSECCVDCTSVNTFKSYIATNYLEPETYFST